MWPEKGGEVPGAIRWQGPVISFTAFFVLAILAACAGCLSSGPQDPGNPGLASTGTGVQDIYLYQNVVNTTGLPDQTYDPAGDSGIWQRAAAIRNAIDVNSPVTRDYAVSIIPRSHGGTFNLAQACDLWENVYRNWTYVNDPRGSEYFSPASHTIALGMKGDCDDFAIVVAAMIESVGGSSRIVTAENGPGGHAYPELYIGDNSSRFDTAAAYIRQRYHVTDVGCHVTESADGTRRYWLNLDWWSRHPGGRFFADLGMRIAYYPDGTWERIEAS